MIVRSHPSLPQVYFLLTCLVVLTVVGCQEHKSARQVCPGHQAEVWDTAVSFYLERGMKRDDVIDPKQLSAFFAEGYVPRCPLGTNNYAPFRILDGPKCPHEPERHAVRQVPARLAKLKEIIR